MAERPDAWDDGGMHTAIRTASPDGFRISAITAEAVRTRGLPGIIIVGLGDASVQESRERVRAALAASGKRIPRGRLVVNLAPAGTRKRGTGLDLAIALTLLGLEEPLPQETPDPLVVGELGLDGSLRAAEGILGIMQMALREGRRLILPAAQAQVAREVEGLRFMPCRDLDEALLALREPGRCQVGTPGPTDVATPEPADWAVLAGYARVAPALLAMAAGGHHTLISGPRGSGKSTLAAATRWLLPPLEPEERLTVARIRQWAGTGMPEDGIPSMRPFRAPQQHMSVAALLGGGSRARPGEASLAHLGVLFLDDAGLRPRTTIEALRAPMDTGFISCHRTEGPDTLPAAFTLLLAGVPCPCGLWGQGDGSCRCLAQPREQVARKLAPALQDRLDIRVTLGIPGVPDNDNTPVLNPAALRAMVAEARSRQLHRAARTGGCPWNGRMSPEELDTCVPPGRLPPPLAGAHAVAGQSWRQAFARRRLALTLANMQGRDVPDEGDLLRATLLRQEAWPEAMLS
ncbi:MAG: ATP-binding protein [Candidatus Sericytochromatia bacterium]|nr:ATP-binding protein [Candidatus Sericytochromatia bacterium]